MSCRIHDISMTTLFAFMLSNNAYFMCVTTIML